MAKHDLIITSAVMWGGKMYRKGDPLTLSEKDARRLLRSGKAELAGTQPSDDGHAAADKGATTSGKRGGQAKKPASGAAAGDAGEA